MINDKLLITGAVLRANGYELGEGKYYGCAKLLSVELESGYVEELLSVNSGNKNYPEMHPNLEFTVGDVENNNLWLVTDTEVRLYRYPDLELLKTYSHPCFHNIHSVCVRGEELYITSTGLDMVVVLDKQSGEIKNEINTEGKDIWHRFSPQVDYRKQHSTRPHDCHPNYVFWSNGQPWVTRCTQGDAVLLSDVSQCIDISGPNKQISIHDGVVKDNYAYFTSVDGCVVIADMQQKKVVESIDMTKIKGYGGLRGWCRGLYMSDDIIYVAFSRIRKTRRMEKIGWISQIIKVKTIENCNILALNLKKMEIVEDYRLPVNMIDAIYSILPEPSST